MISKNTFTALCSLFIIIVGVFFGLHFTHDHGLKDVLDKFDLLHYIDHHDKTDDKPVDTHVHKMYWIENQEKPGTLIKVKNQVYGEPKPDMKHRHTGADYIQAGIATWKHVNDQHQKMEKKE